MRQFKAHQEFIKQPATKAGDVIIFTEATTHGTLPWTADRQRRSILFIGALRRLGPQDGAEAFCPPSRDPEP